MWVHNLNPVLLKLGSLEARYYGLVYVLGFFISVFWLRYCVAKFNPPHYGKELRSRVSHPDSRLILSKEEIWDFVFYLMLGVLIGSRLFMVFWEPSVYLMRPWELLMIWHGGMSFHGGLVGIGIAAWLYCKKKKLNLGRMADILSLPAIFVLALGRVANFINGELVGRITSVKWCVKFPSHEGCRHPSTLYAAGKRFLVFGWLLFLFLREGMFKFKKGFIFWNFVFFEGLGRIIVDFYRFDELYWGFSLGQWFSLVMVLVALVVFVKYYKEDWKGLLKMDIN